MNSEQHPFSRSSTHAVKGVAILLMLCHHLWGFKARTPVGDLSVLSPNFSFQIKGMEPLLAIARFGKICVPMYFFLAGYGLYLQYAKGHFSLWKKIKGLYKRFWRVFFIFIPIAFIFFSKQPRLTDKSISFNQTYSAFHIVTFVKNVFGLSCEYNKEWWFLAGVLIAYIVGYVYISVTRKTRNFYLELLMLCLICVLCSRIIPKIESEAFVTLRRSIVWRRFLNQMFISFFVGIVFAKYGALDRLILRLRLHPLPVRVFLSIAGCIAIVYIFLSTKSPASKEYVMVMCPFFIALLTTLLDICKPVRAVFTFLGKHSTNMWLVHTFYAYYFSAFVRLVFFSRNAVINLLVLVLLSLVTSMALDCFYNLLSRLIGRLRKHPQALSS